MIGAMGVIRRLLGGSQAAPVKIVDLGSVAGPVYAIGDVHGCRVQLRAALAAVREDAAALKSEPTILLLGDLVDRGPDSAGVLDDLAETAADGRLIGILGNHERMMLAFIQDPARSWDWLTQGGFETLCSYGLSLSPRQKYPAGRVVQMLRAHIPERHIQWLQDMPHIVTAQIDGAGFAFVHAGLDRRRALTAQDESAVLWGRGVSGGFPGLRVVQGHITVENPVLTDSVIRIDTGAHKTGRLTVLRLVTGRPISAMCFTETGASKFLPVTLSRT